MFDYIVQAIADYPYIGVAAVFLLCGLGLPLPEEIVLLAAGFVCAKYPDHAQLGPMMGWCGCAILVGDMIPFLLGRVFGVRLLRLRWLRYFITKQRLATFDRWFRRRGDMVIVISRFLAGLRMVAFFTAGAMKMRWSRFLLLDGLGIVLLVPLLTWLGYSSAAFIDEVIETVQTVERGLLWGGGATLIVLAAWLWWWRRRRQQRQRRELTETFVQPKKPRTEQSTATDAAPPTEADRLAKGGSATAPRPTSIPDSIDNVPETAETGPGDESNYGSQDDTPTGETEGPVKP